MKKSKKQTQVDYEMSLLENDADEMISEGNRSNAIKLAFVLVAAVLGLMATVYVPMRTSAFVHTIMSK